MKKLLTMGILLLITLFAVGCSKAKLYTNDDMTQLHDVIGFIEKENLEYKKVIAASLPTVLGEKLTTDMEFVDYLSTRNIDPNKPVIALTFDDGPRTDSTNAILDVLEQYNAKATFFMLGDNIGQNTEETIKRVISLGCEIGNHSQSHELLSDLDAAGIKNQIEPVNEKILELTGRECRVVRPPYGGINSTVQSTIKQPLILWNIDTLDWKSRDPDQIVPIILSYVEDGDIILMHDIYGTTAEAVRRVVPKLVEQGYQLVTIPELAYLKGIKLEAGQQYTSLSAPNEENN